MKQSNSTKKLMRTAIHSDANGNKIIIDHYKDVATIKLKLHAEGRQRNIGTLDIPNRRLYVKRQKDKHLFLKMNAYGLNHHILKEAKLFDTIFLNDNENTWAIPREYILEHGKFLNFSNHGGFELQIFISLDIIKQFKVKAML
jgi:hypothetical protein